MREAVTGFTFPFLDLEKVIPWQAITSQLRAGGAAALC